MTIITNQNENNYIESKESVRIYLSEMALFQIHVRSLLYNVLKMCLILISDAKMLALWTEVSQWFF